MTKLKWITIQGPHAFCEDCDWFYPGDEKSRSLIRIARNHSEENEHTVQIQRGQLAIIERADNGI